MKLLAEDTDDDHWERYDSGFVYGTGWYAGAGRSTGDGTDRGDGAGSGAGDGYGQDLTAYKTKKP